MLRILFYKVTKPQFRNEHKAGKQHKEVTIHQQFRSATGGQKRKAILMVFQTLAKNYISFKNTISSVYELQYALKAFLKGAEQNKLLEERHCDSHVYMTLDLRVFTVDQTNNVLFLSLLKIFSPEYFADREKSQFRYVCQKFIQQTLKNIQDQRDSQLETNTYTFKA